MRLDLLQSSLNSIVIKFLNPRKLSLVAVGLLTVTAPPLFSNFNDSGPGYNNTIVYGYASSYRHGLIGGVLPGSLSLGGRNYSSQIQNAVEQLDQQEAEK